MIDAAELDALLGPIVIIQARVHDHDVQGVIDITGSYEHIDIPMTYDSEADNK